MNVDSADLPFKIRIGMFDEKFGPICLNASKGGWCEFVGEECGGLTSPAIVDAMAINKNNMAFEEENWYFQVINIQIHNPKVRGRQNRFTIIIKYDKNLGKIQEKYIANIRKDFYTQFGASKTNKDNESFDKIDIGTTKPSFEDIGAFTNKWELIFSNSHDITDIMEKDAELSKLKETNHTLNGFYRPNYILPRRQRMVLVIIIGSLVLGLITAGSFFGFGEGEYRIISIMVSIIIIFIIMVMFRVFLQRRGNQDNRSQQNNSDAKTRLVITLTMLFVTIISLIISIFTNN